MTPATPSLTSKMKLGMEVVPAAVGTGVSALGLTVGCLPLLAVALRGKEEQGMLRS